MADKPGLSPVVQQSMETASAAAAQKNVLMANMAAAGGGAWAWLGTNSQQVGIIIAAISFIWAGVNQWKSAKRQRQRMDALEQHYEDRLREMELQLARLRRD